MARKRKNVNLSLSMKNLLSLVPSEENREALSDMGLKYSEMNNGAVVIAALFNKAAKGEVSAIKELRDIIGDDDGTESGDLSALYRALERDDV